MSHYDHTWTVRIGARAVPPIEGEEPKPVPTAKALGEAITEQLNGAYPDLEFTCTTEDTDN